jgi:putative sterol carrier protein
LTDLSSQLSKALSQLDKAMGNDAQFQAFANTRAITKPVTFGLKAVGPDKPVLVTVEDGKGYATSKTVEPDFTLVARPEQWQEFFKQTPQMPYQSYWGMFGMNIK